MQNLAKPLQCTSQLGAHPVCKLLSPCFSRLHSCIPATSQLLLLLPSSPLFLQNFTDSAETTHYRQVQPQLRGTSSRTAGNRPAPDAGTA